MKVLLCGVREDEKETLNRVSKSMGIEPTYFGPNLNSSNLDAVKGFDLIAVTAGSQLNRENLTVLAGMGVRFIASRSIGFDNVDLEACKELGIKFSNAPYSPHSVADYTVMLMLMLTRRMREILRRGAVQDYGYDGFQGRELNSLTVGVVGTGRIGRTVIEDLSGFGPKILGYDLYPNDALRDKVEYVSLEELLARADIVTLHAPLQESSYHMINAKSISGMKDGALLLNTARGELVDTDALIDALESGKLGGAALDVLEGERAYTFADHRGEVIKSRNRAILTAMPNVLVTGHYAFYTDEAVEDMARVSLGALKQFAESGHVDGEIV